MPAFSRLAGTDMGEISYVNIWILQRMFATDG